LPICKKRTIRIVSRKVTSSYPVWFRLFFVRSRPGQEEGNIPFVEEAGFGTYSSNPAEIAATVSAWLASPDELQQMKKAALAAARPQATMDIARDILSLLEERLE
jgi:UDP-N-acetylglucosamine:LPS N-acetylglucosamine transferase